MKSTKTLQPLNLIKKLKFYTILGFIAPIIALLAIGLPIILFDFIFASQDSVHPYGLALQYPILAVLVYIIFVFLQTKDYRKRFRLELPPDIQLRFKSLYCASAISLFVNLSLPIIAILSLFYIIIIML